MNRIKISRVPQDLPARPKRIGYWQILIDVYNEFAAETSIHGLKYTTQRKLKTDGFIWLTIVSISIVCAGLLSSRFYERHRAASMRTTVVSTQHPAWDLQLPAVTLCHGTMATRQKLESYLNSHETLKPKDVPREELINAVRQVRKAIEPSNTFPRELEVMQELLNSNALQIHEFLEKVGPNCSEYLIVCKRANREVPCKSLMSPSLTPYGLCCSFNYHHASSARRRFAAEESKDQEHHSVTYGARFLLSFLMNPLQEDRLSSAFYGDGIKVLIHEPLNYPGPAALEFVAPSGHETIASVNGNRLTSSSEVLSIGQDVRRCVIVDESSPPYRKSNCYVSCRERIIRNICRCQTFYSFTNERDFKFCNFSHMICLSKNMIGSSSLKPSDPECRCIPECEETSYSVETTTIPLNAPEFAPSPFYKDVNRIPNATALHITLASQVMTLQRRDVVQSWINLLSSLGGVFSLFLGCSFISLVEILYFFCICLPNKLRMRRNRNPTTKR
ncbi:sodium channel protein Nach-like isoform X1 [Neodiprion pinetum]|uniref:sodium channel protein Nach-like isoform X1 n=1 Tax=Neodiprion pinetum TaxID=441929 RepID=UPI001EE04C30|nr:sodium channel protein Nach-like isoform X1 [Neodiprion pinetum]